MSSFFYNFSFHFKGPWGYSNQSFVCRGDRLASMYGRWGHKKTWTAWSSEIYQEG